MSRHRRACPDKRNHVGSSNLMVGRRDSVAPIFVELARKHDLDWAATRMHDLFWQHKPLEDWPFQVSEPGRHRLEHR